MGVMALGPGSQGGAIRAQQVSFPGAKTQGKTKTKTKVVRRSPGQRAQASPPAQAPGDLEVEVGLALPGERQPMLGRETLAYPASLDIPPTTPLPHTTVKQAAGGRFVRAQLSPVGWDSGLLPDSEGQGQTCMLPGPGGLP